ncbi:MAG: preprotein translocase subunit SecE [Christensenellales bacterium]|nr:preprotein translocase subunit SecE [Christensenellales bacterium]
MANVEGKNVKPNFFVRFGKGVVSFVKKVGRFFMNMKHELKKVTWPTRKDMVNYSLVVFGFMLVMMVIIGVFDVAASALVDFIVSF